MSFQQGISHNKKRSLRTQSLSFNQYWLEKSLAENYLCTLLPSFDSTMPNKVALILGYGPHVGVQVASTFASKDYKIAVLSRSDKHTSTTQGYLFLQADLSDPASVEGVFATVVEKLGHPSVVVYNGMSISCPLQKRMRG